jgi:subtilisin family serine protease
MNTMKPSKHPTRGTCARKVQTLGAFMILAVAIHDGLCGWAEPGYDLAAVPRIHTSGELLVKFAPGTEPARIEAAHQRLGATVVRSFESIGWQFVRLPPRASLHAGMDYYRQSAEVQAVEPNGVYGMASIPDDPEFPQQWALPRVGADAAWEISTGSGEVVVAVIGSGIDYQHEDLRDNLWVNSAEIAANGIDDDANGYLDDMHGIDTGNDNSDPMDVIGHDTRTAGIIGARGNNGRGGVGMNWSVQMIALKVTSEPLAATTTTALLEAYEYLLTLKRRGVNIRVTNNSYGGSSFSQALLDILNVCGTENILHVCAAGNTSTDTDEFPTYPGSYDSAYIISTAASDSLDQLTDTSNFGAQSVDLTAPGQNLYTTATPGYVSDFSGTSAAAAMVTGAVALMASAAPAHPALSLKAHLLKSVDVVPGLTNRVATSGRLNVAAALQSLEAAPALLVNQTAGGNLELGWPAWAADFTLHQATRLGSTADWQGVAGTPTLQGDQYKLTVGATETARFFRLLQQ